MSTQQPVLSPAHPRFTETPPHPLRAASPAAAVSPPPDSISEPLVRRLQGYGNRVLASGFVLLATVVAIVAVALQTVRYALDPVLLSQDGYVLRLTSVWILVTFACALPSLLMYCMRVLAVGSAGSQLRLDLCSMGSSRADGELMKEVRATWAREIDQLDQRNGWHARQVTFYGLFGTLLLSTATMLYLERFRRDPTALTPAVSAIGLALGAAVMSAFLTDVGRMLVRAANQDASARMFAWSTKRLLLIVVGTVLLCCLILLGKANTAIPGDTSAVMSWLLIGTGMAFLGDRAALAVGDRVAGMLGVPPARRASEGDLLRIDGIGEEEAARLAEEGITTVHTLAFAPTLTLFLSTPYTWQQICDWQDQCLLAVRLGPAKTVACREQLLWRGATDAQRSARDLLKEPLFQGKQQEIARILGFAGDAQATVVLRQLAEDSIATRLDVYRHTSPYLYFEAMST